MSRVLCKKCNRYVDSGNVICINCGTHLASGMHISDYQATMRRQNKRHFLPRLKTVFKIFVVLASVLAIIISCSCIWRYYRQYSNSNPRVAANGHELPQNSAPARDVGELAERKELIPDQLPQLPANKEYVAIGIHLFPYVSRQRSVVKIDIPVPDEVGGQLRLKLYQGQAPKSEFQLKADSLGTVAEYNLPVFQPSVVDRIKARLADPKTPEPLKKSLENQLASIQKMQQSRPLRMKNHVTFTVKDVDADIKYFLPVLCRPDGTVIKKYGPLIAAQGFAGAPLSQNMALMRLANSTEDAVFPRFEQNSRTLVCRFADPSTIEFDALLLDGEEIDPIILPDNGRKNQITIDLNYPFSAQVTLKFSIGRRPDAPGKKVELSFPLPPPAPYYTVRYENNEAVINWDDVGAMINPQDYSRLPEVKISGQAGAGNVFPADGKVTSCRFPVSDKPGTRRYVGLSLGNGVIKSAYWSARDGVKSAEISLPEMKPPFQSDALLQDTETNNPLRVVMLKRDICFENTGIPAAKLNAAVVKRLQTCPQISLLEQSSRDYIRNEKLIKMSKELRQEFESGWRVDMYVQIRDFSRQDGNGVELWLNKGGNEGQWWRIAELKNDGGDSRQALAAAADALAAKILAVSDYAPGRRDAAAQVKPDRIVMMPLRPLNQSRVVTNARLIGESIMLQMNNSDSKIKIFSEADWMLALNERLSNGSSGGYDFIKGIHEIMVTGNVWREDDRFHFNFIACDVFSGEILGTRYCSGDLTETARQLGAWLGELRLHDNAFAASGQKGGYLRVPSLPRYGNFCSMQESYRRNDVSGSAGMDVLALAQKNWDDGYKDKALAQVQKEWNEKKSIASGAKLVGFYAAVGRRNDALALCRQLMERDDCPEDMVKRYNNLRREEKTGDAMDSAAVSPAKTPRELPPVSKERANTGRLVMSNDCDYEFDYTYYDEKGRKVEERFERKYLYRPEEELYRSYFIDRDTIGEEWSPGAPCRTSRLALRVPAALLSQGIKSEFCEENGVWISAFRHAFMFSFNSDELIPMAYLRRGSYKEPMMNVTDELFNYLKSIRSQAEQTLKPEIFIIQGAWNSYDPFDEDIPEPYRFTRLAYFFIVYNEKICFFRNLYSGSRVRALLELEKRPDLKIPGLMTFNIGRREFVRSELKTGKDMFIIFIKEIPPWIRNDIGRMKLENLLALEYVAKHEDLAEAEELWRKVINVKLPRNMEEYCKFGVNEEFLIFMASRKNKSAEKMLLEYWKNASPDSDRAAEYVYLLSQRGNVDFLAQLVSRCHDNAVRSLRWAPSEVLNTLLTEYRDKIPKDGFRYLALGTGNQAAAKPFLLRYGDSSDHDFLCQVYGVPPAEAYRNWGLDYMKKHKRKNQNAEK